MIYADNLQTLFTSANVTKSFIYPQPVINVHVKKKIKDDGWQMESIKTIPKVRIRKLFPKAARCPDMMRFLYLLEAGPGLWQ